jgi:hypothetical protein
MYNSYYFAKLPKEYINNIISKYPYITPEILISLRSAYVLQQIVKNINKINTKHLIKNYDKKISILTLSKKYKIPPLLLLRIVYKFKKYSKENITKILNNKNTILKGYDEQQLILAQKNDVFTVKNEYEQLQQSLAFEKQVESILITHNITYKTQEMLIKESPYSTPDFLLTSELKIHNNIIRWIEVKNFYGTCTKFNHKKIQEQINKYIKLYGNGCLIFSLGYCSDLQFDNTIILSFDEFTLLLLNV